MRRLRHPAVLVLVCIAALGVLTAMTAASLQDDKLQCVHMLNGRPWRDGGPMPTAPAAGPGEPGGLGVAVPEVRCLGYDRHHRLGLLPIQSLVGSDGRVHGE